MTNSDYEEKSESKNLKNVELLLPMPAYQNFKCSWNYFTIEFYK